MDFETMVRVIRQRVGFGQTMAEIHDSLAAESWFEETMFFLAWHSAVVLEMEVT